jgi:hypothetical protein
MCGVCRYSARSCVVIFTHTHYNYYCYFGMNFTVDSSRVTHEDFAGVWQRTAIYEPKGTLGPEKDQKKTVIWVQSKDGAFIDIRFDQGQSYDPLLLKSFSGTVSYEWESAHFTWHRQIDYRVMVCQANESK